MKTVIHVNQYVIRNNSKTGESDPPLTVKTYKDNRLAHEALIKNDQGEIVAKVVYRPDSPLSCGAKVWIETHHQVVTL